MLTILMLYLKDLSLVFGSLFSGNEVHLEKLIFAPLVKKVEITHLNGSQIDVIILYSIGLFLSVKLGDFRVFLCTDYKNVRSFTVLFGKLHLC
jgi:hypothetical protein